MTKLTSRQIYKIIDCAPHWQKCFCLETNQRLPYDNYRNLSDLREIFELRKQNSVLVEKMRNYIV